MHAFRMYAYTTRIIICPIFGLSHSAKANRAKKAGHRLHWVHVHMNSSSSHRYIAGHQFFAFFLSRGNRQESESHRKPHPLLPKGRGHNVIETVMSFLSHTVKTHRRKSGEIWRKSGGRHAVQIEEVINPDFASSVI